MGNVLSTIWRVISQFVSAVRSRQLTSAGFTEEQPTGNVLTTIWRMISQFFSADRSRQLTSAGFTEEQLCQNLHKRSPEEQRLIRQQADSAGELIEGMTLEDWFGRLPQPAQRSESVATAPGSLLSYDESLLSAGFTEEQLCQNLHKRSPEEQRLIRQQADDAGELILGMTFEDWSGRLPQPARRSESVVTAHGTLRPS